MSSEFDLSILVVNWNGREMLRGLLRSIADTRGPLNVQTIVVDNASADESAEMVAADFPQVTIIRNAENRGFARANNQAAAVAAAPLLLLLNNDTVLRNSALQSMVDFLATHPEVVAVGPKLIGGDGQPQWTGRNLPTVKSLLNTIHFLSWTGIYRAAYQEYRRGTFDPEQSGPVGQLAAAALTIRADAFRSCQGFDEQYPFGVEDVDLCNRLSKFGSIYYLSTATIEHLGRISSRANRGFVYRGYEIGWARYLKKYFGDKLSKRYKILVTIDMPIRLTELCRQWAWQQLTGRDDKAERTKELINAASEFTFKGLWTFWQV